MGKSLRRMLDVRRLYSRRREASNTFPGPSLTLQVHVQYFLYISDYIYVRIVELKSIEFASHAFELKSVWLVSLDLSPSIGLSSFVSFLRQVLPILTPLTAIFVIILYTEDTLCPVILTNKCDVFSLHVIRSGPVRLMRQH